MLRVGLFILTNLAVITVAGVVLSMLGVGSSLQANGVDLDLVSLLIICAVFGFSGALISLFLSKTMARMSTGTQIIERPSNSDEQWLVNTVKDLSAQAGIGMPDVGIFPAAEANAFATGWNRNKALVAVSAGLMQRYDREKVRAILGHEIGHVANGDMVTLTLIQGVVNTFVMFFARIIGHFVDRVVFKTERGYGIGYYVVSFVAQIVLAILASMIVMWFSRRREYRADAAGALLAGRGAMIGALQQLQAEQNRVPSSMPESMTAFGISSNAKKSLAHLFSSHPPLDERIAALSNG